MSKKVVKTVPGNVTAEAGEIVQSLVCSKCDIKGRYQCKARIMSIESWYGDGDAWEVKFECDIHL